MVRVRERDRNRGGRRDGRRENGNGQGKGKGKIRLLLRGERQEEGEEGVRREGYNGVFPDCFYS